MFCSEAGAKHRGVKHLGAKQNMCELSRIPMILLLYFDKIRFRGLKKPSFYVIMLVIYNKNTNIHYTV